MEPIMILLAVIAIVVVYAISIFNGLKTKGVQVEQSLSTIEAYLEERFDLLTKLVSSVNEESKREIELQTELAKARSGIKNGFSGMQEADAIMSRIQVQVEAYPETKFNEGFRQLQRSIVAIEDKLSAARRAYNAQVSAYNQMLVTFPTNIFASAMNFTEKEFFKASEQKREDVNMSDLFSK